MSTCARTVRRVFGTNKRFTTTWAVGVAWNLHNEPFLKNLTDAFSMFKLRSSIGNPRKPELRIVYLDYHLPVQQLDDEQFRHRIVDQRFRRPGSRLAEDHKPQCRYRPQHPEPALHLTFDYYNKHTDPLLASVGIPLSVGTSSRLMNIGQQINTVERCVYPLCNPLQTRTAHQLDRRCRFPAQSGLLRRHRRQTEPV